MSIPVAVELLLITFDQYRDVLNGATPVSLSQEYQELISLKERQAVDATIASFWRDFEDRARRELQRLEGDGGSSEEKSLYPLSMETAATAGNIFLDKIKDEVAHDHFARYQNDPVKIQYIMAAIRLGSKAERESTVGSAFLPFIVSRIEGFLSALVRTALILHPNSFGELDDVPNVIIKKYQTNISSSDILRWQIDHKVTGALKGPPEAWSELLRKRTGLDISSVGGDWRVIVEVIQRRHAIIHNNGRVDSDYMEKVAPELRVGLDEGSVLVCGNSYMMGALVELETWALCLSFYWAKHFFKDTAQYYPLVISRTVELERLGRWTQALAVLDAYLREPLPHDLSDVPYVRINRWFCMQQIGKGSEALEREIREWESRNLSTQEKFQFDMGRAAILRDYGEVVRLLRSATGSETVSFRKKYLREMPLFKRAMTESPPVARLLQGPDHQTIRTVSRPQRRGRGGKMRR